MIAFAHRSSVSSNFNFLPTHRREYLYLCSLTDCTYSIANGIIRSGCEADIFVYNSPHPHANTPAKNTHSKNPIFISQLQSAAECWSARSTECVQYARNTRRQRAACVHSINAQLSSEATPLRKNISPAHPPVWLDIRSHALSMRLFLPLFPHRRRRSRLLLACQASIKCRHTRR